MNAVQFQAVSKSYAIYDSPRDRLTELLTLNRIALHRDFKALDDVSFEIGRGETFCIVGENGSGKSTLLQIVAGILQPSAGSVAVNGRVSALLELGAGFSPDFSGRDNVYLKAAVLGFSRREIDRRYREIAEFAEIGNFIDQPVKTYSSGMAMRLAFAVAINVDPEVLLVDEALAVGDFYFRQRCMRKVQELRSRGVTILFVSHAASEVKAIGDRALWLDHGRLAAIGSPDTVVSSYLKAMSEKDEAYRRGRSEPGAIRRETPATPGVVTTVPNVDHRYGDGRAEILGIAIYDENGSPLQLLDPSTKILVRISVRAKAAINQPVVGFTLRNQLGMEFSGADTSREGRPPAPMRDGDICTVDFRLELPELYPAAFSFSPVIADGGLAEENICDWIDNAVALQMSRTEDPVYGYVHLPCRVMVNARMRDAGMTENSLG